MTVILLMDWTDGKQIERREFKSFNDASLYLQGVIAGVSAMKEFGDSFRLKLEVKVEE